MERGDSILTCFFTGWLIYLRVCDQIDAKKGRIHDILPFSLLDVTLLLHH